MRRSIFQRGRDEIEAWEAREAQMIADNVAVGKHSIRRSFVFRFYHDTMTDTNLSGAYHKFGPESPDPEIKPERTPGPLGGSYRDVAWRFKWDGIRWLAEYRWDSADGGWWLDFYVKTNLWTWERVASPAQVVKALRSQSREWS